MEGKFISALITRKKNHILEEEVSLPRLQVEEAEKSQEILKSHV